MSTLSQFFTTSATNASFDQSVTRIFTESGTMTLPSEAKYVTYGVMAGGGTASLCCTNSSCCNFYCAKSGRGGGFSYYEGSYSNPAPIELTITVGAGGALNTPCGGNSCLTGPGIPCITAYGCCVTPIGGTLNFVGGNGTDYVTLLNAAIVPVGSPGCCQFPFSLSIATVCCGGGGGAAGIFGSGQPAVGSAGGGYSQFGGPGGHTTTSCTPIGGICTVCISAQNGKTIANYCTDLSLYSNCLISTVSGGTYIRASSNTLPCTSYTCCAMFGDSGYQIGYTGSGLLSKTKTYFGAVGGGGATASMTAYSNPQACIRLGAGGAGGGGGGGGLIELNPSPGPEGVHEFVGGVGGFGGGGGKGAAFNYSPIQQYYLYNCPNLGGCGGIGGGGGWGFNGLYLCSCCLVSCPSCQQFQIGGLGGKGVVVVEYFRNV